MSQAGHQCVGACEIDSYARLIYAKQFPSIRIWEDATKINPSELPDFDVLTGGFPCQAFSIAGKRKGFEDTRGSMFFEIARIAKEKRPRYLLLENVKGLLNHDQGNTFRVIISTLDEMGYDAEWQVLNSKYFVPQNRERVFIVGHLRGESTRKIFPLGDIHKKTAEPKLQQLNETPHDTGRIYHPDGIARSLRANSGGMGSKTGLYAVKSIQRCGDRDKKTYSQKDISHCLSSNPMSDYQNKVMIVTKDHDKLRETKDESLAIDANYWKGPDNHGQRTLVHVIGSTQKNAAHKVDESTSLTEAMGKGGGHVPMIYMAHSKGNIKQRIQNRSESWTLSNNASDFGVIEHTIIADRSRTYAGKGRSLESPKKISNSLTSVAKDNYVLEETKKPKEFGIIDDDGRKISNAIRQGGRGSLDRHSWDVVNDKTRIRRLTPKECERLQGFPDDWTRTGKDSQEISDTQRYKCLGNAVTVPVVQFVAENLE